MMEPQDYESPDGYCDECLDEAIVFDEETEDASGKHTLNYHCPACLKTFTVDDTPFDAYIPFLLPRYDNV